MMTALRTARRNPATALMPGAPPAIRRIPPAPRRSWPAAGIPADRLRTRREQPCRIRRRDRSRFPDCSASDEARKVLGRGVSSAGSAPAGGASVNVPRAAARPGMVVARPNCGYILRPGWRRRRRPRRNRRILHPGRIENVPADVFVSNPGPRPGLRSRPGRRIRRWNIVPECPGSKARGWSANITRKSALRRNASLGALSNFGPKKSPMPERMATSWRTVTLAAASLLG